MTTSPESAETPASPAGLGLSGKQLEVLALLMQGKSNKQICRVLDLAEPTVKYHVSTILKALNATNRTEAVLAVGKLGWKLPVVAEREGNAASGTSAAAARSDPAAQKKPQAEGPDPTAGHAAESPPLALPDKPSIVVLPFTNLSGDASQDYFVDGMVEDITIALGRLPWLFVMGSFAAFTYKNRAVDLRQVGNELGVRYVMRGSVRKEGNRVRITSQLTDASHGGHIWADRIEGELESVFEMQDRVAAQVSAAIAPALRNEEIERARRKPTENLTAYDLFLRALPNTTASMEQNQESLCLLHRAIELDPSYSAAYGLAAWCHFWRKMVGWTSPSDPGVEEGLRLAERAAELGTNDSEAQWMAAHAFTLLGGEIDRSIQLAERALSLNPNSPNAWWARAISAAYLGGTNADAGVEYHARALRLNPVDPWACFYLQGIAASHFFAGRHEEAVTAADQPLGRQPSFAPSLRLKAAACGLTKAASACNGCSS